MVAPNSPRLDFRPQLNFSRAYLFRAADALAAGRTIEAGCLLREAVRRQLFAECAWKNCLPDDATDRTPPVVLLRALKRAGHCTNTGWSIAFDCIDLGNKLAHCHRVSRQAVECAIAFFHDFIDADPCAEPANMSGKLVLSDPWLTNPDDDDDSADWWKGVAV